MRSSQIIKRETLHISAALLGTIVATSLVVGFLVQKHGKIKKFDDYFYNLIHNKINSKILDKLNNIFQSTYRNKTIFFLPSFFYPILGTFFIYMLLNKRKKLVRSFITIALGTLFSGILLKIHWRLMFRKRPFLTLPNRVHPKNLSSLKSWPSFPSGHSRDIALYSTIISSFAPLFKFPLIILSSIVGLTRVYAGVHYPSDVLAGLFIGHLLGRVAVFTTKEAKIIKDEIKGELNEKLKKRR